ncbi:MULTISPECIES: HWE histidine kinase domain-containing protein [Mesorhizobium]|uniref:histidine kinase n=1 Tax=Mesorhizobium denitrificans TaxID=2294114 RepID=A0A371XJ30_9HYPH|nr:MULTISPECIES: HWE histidine kinase domain-containing protein [Mesorhizobium]RFC69064.1 GAF domain-containing protein [Mesorhizobium denitrificans]
MNSEPVNLTNCDREPIHVPGSIQPHGCLLACDSALATFSRCSENAANMLGIADGDLIGAPVEQTIGREARAKVMTALKSFHTIGRPAMLFGVELPGGRRFDLAVHEHRGTVIIEFEPAENAEEPFALARQLIGNMGELRSSEKLIMAAARSIKTLLKYDRVMVYRFDTDGSGKVIAELKRPDLESFLGQYFPATDIPQQARALYLRNTIRIISDASGPRAAILPPSGAALDLTFAHLRSVSPIHLEYLRNMGVGASMSISIILNGELWGLIACHHYSPKYLGMAQRVAAEMFGEFFSLHLAASLTEEKLAAATHARSSLDCLLSSASTYSSVGDLLKSNFSALMDLIPSDGAGVWLDGQWFGYGAAPAAGDAKPLVSWLRGDGDARIWSTHSLSATATEFAGHHANFAGVLAIPLAKLGDDCLFFFRREKVKNLDWAGNPDKTYETGPLGDRLTPRKSFSIWKETVRNQAQPWEDTELQTAETLRVALVDILLQQSELLEEERQKSDLRQKMLNQELNHRVKNILAIIKSLIEHPLEPEGSLEKYVSSLKGRIQALSHAHDQVVRGDNGGLFEDLVRSELSPYWREGITIAGPAVWLDARAYSVMALVLHELATNAAKYGSLSSKHGKLAVKWSIENGHCEIRWKESDGPAVLPPKRTGFGSVLIERSVPYDLKGSSRINYDPHGVTAQFSIPSKFVSLADQPTTGERAQSVDAAQTSGLSGDMVVMVVEDQMLIAMDLEAILEDAGAKEVIVASSTAEALSLLEERQPTVAILDLNLGHETSLPVADALSERGIPFAFATGYGDAAGHTERFADVPVVRKPYDSESIMNAVAVALADHSANRDRSPR